MPRIRPLQFLPALLFLSSLFAGLVGSEEAARRPPRTEASEGLPPDVVAHRLLTPPLRGSATLGFSPDGRYLLVQDRAGIFVLSREPLALVLYADAVFPTPLPTPAFPGPATVFLCSPVTRKLSFLT